MQVKPLSMGEVSDAIHKAAIRRQNSKGQELKEMLGHGGMGMYMKLMAGDPKPQVPLKEMRYAFEQYGLTEGEKAHMKAACDIWGYGLRPTEEAEVDEILKGYGATRKTPRHLKEIIEERRKVWQARDRHWTEEMLAREQTDRNIQEWLKEFGYGMAHFTKPVLNPFAIDQDRGHRVSGEVLDRAFELGLFRTDAPLLYGGLGLHQQETDFVLSMLPSFGAGLATIASVMKSIGSKPITAFGTTAQRDYFIPPLVHGDKDGRYSGAFMLTEEGAGTNAIGQMKKQVELMEKDGQLYWKLNGRDSIFHTNAYIAGLGHCGVNVIDPKTGTKLPSVIELKLPFRFSDTPQITDRKVAELWRQGFEIAGDPQELIGIRGSNQAYWEAYDYLVPVEYEPGVHSILGGLDGIGKGAEYIFGGLNKGRGGFINLCAFTAEVALDYTLDAVCDKRKKERFPKLGDGTLSALQPVKGHIAEMAIDAEMLRAYGELTSAWIDAFPDSNVIAEAAIGKAMASDILCKTVSTMFRLRGGMGILKGDPMEMLFRDAPINLLVEGVNDAMYQHGAGVSVSPLLALQSSLLGKMQVLGKILGRASKETGGLDPEAARQLQKDAKHLSASAIIQAGIAETFGKGMQQEGIALIEIAQREFKLMARAAAMFKIEELKKRGNPDDKKRIVALQLFCDREAGKKVTKNELLRVAQMYIDDAKIRINTRYREDEGLVKKYS